MFFSKLPLSSFSNFSNFANKFFVAVCCLFLLILPVQTLLAQYAVNVLNLPEFVVMWKEALTLMLSGVLLCDLLFKIQQNQPHFGLIFKAIWPLLLAFCLTIWMLFSSFFINSLPLFIVVIGFRFELWWLIFFGVVNAWLVANYTFFSKNSSKNSSKSLSKNPEQLNNLRQDPNPTQRANPNDINDSANLKNPLKSSFFWYKICFVTLLFSSLLIGIFAINLPSSVLQKLPTFISKPSSTHFHAMRTFATLEILKQNPIKSLTGYGLAASGPAAKHDYYQIDKFPLFLENEKIAYQHDLVGEDLMIPENWFLQTALNGGLIYALFYLILACVPIYCLFDWIIKVKRPKDFKIVAFFENLNSNSQNSNSQSSQKFVSAKTFLYILRFALFGFVLSTLVTFATIVFGQENILPFFGFGKESLGNLTTAPLAHLIDGGGWNSAFRLSGSFSTPNHFAGYLLIIFPVLSLGILLDKKFQLLYKLALLASFGFIILSFARFAWLGLAVILLIWLMSYFYFSFFKDSSENSAEKLSKKILYQNLSLLLFPLAFFAILIGNLFLHVWENQTIALLWTVVWSLFIIQNGEVEEGKV